MTKHMPDIACQPHHGPQGKLNWVGMSGIELPILIQQGLDKDNIVTLSSQAQAYVDLNDPQSKGIHMSRLYLHLDQMASQEPLSSNRVKAILEAFINSHQGLSTQAFVEFKFDYYERRNSLLSDNSGWKHYPATIRGEMRQGQYSCELSIEVPYSSTCPCSAALSRQLIQEAFEKQFSGAEMDYQTVFEWLGTPEGICATPHSQRSYAQVKVKISESDDLALSVIINQIENALQTPVQAVVKREDEQEFARLNATNLMFCEDASRRLQNAFENNAEYLDFWIRVNHLESLHPHDAVAVVTKGIENGYIDDPNLMDPM
ncbi:GTP cyclohydrolase FolE2 [Thiomicrorhabdus lithotrophica]|uniref:GTP cyclohydrolase FolE2 n=1 Tax=Thiomicrorhabdus lithotrophica TaxID=2949997 RepID=A0ABY8C8R1_9GAMM|nr:GTP cyclohydrolase FolE2 [Thiomicrorhabdus lithotrophica]WEJ62361.1 GTP cyclohydrolase FolE2 [Thiomicrorhabdus lithotrophica]